MNKYTKKLSYFLQTNIKNYKKQLYKESSFVAFIQKTFTNIKLETITMSKKYNSSIPDKLLIGDYVSKKIEKHDLVSVTYKMNNNTVTIYTKNENDLPNIKLIMKIILLIKELSKNTKIVEIYIFCGDIKKCIPHIKKNIISSEHMNSGYSVDSFIFIWRKEEIYKVLIHELIHNLDLDFNTQNNNALDKHVHKIFNINGINVANETYTEILALTINSVIFSMLHDVDFNSVINSELIMTHFQIAKILNHFGGITYDDLFTVKIKQSTSVVSYIIVKGMLLNNYQQILNLWDKKSNFKEYETIFLNFVNKNGLNKDLINKFVGIIDEINSNFIRMTMRMVICDI